MSKNTKIIIILSVAAALVVFATNVLPDLIDETSSKSGEYHYETTFPTGRPSESNSVEEIPTP